MRIIKKSMIKNVNLEKTVIKGIKTVVMCQVRSSLFCPDITFEGRSVTLFSFVTCQNFDRWIGIWLDKLNPGVWPRYGLLCHLKTLSKWLKSSAKLCFWLYFRIWTHFYLWEQIMFSNTAVTQLLGRGCLLRLPAAQTAQRCSSSRPANFQVPNGCSELCFSCNYDSQPYIPLSNSLILASDPWMIFLSWLGTLPGAIK